MGCPCFLLCNICFLGQSDADFDAFLEAGFFVVTAEGTDRVDDLVHFPEGFAVHGYVEIIEVLPDDLVIESIELRVDIEQHLQQGFRVAILVVRRVGFHIGF